MEGRILESTSRLVLSGFRTVVWFVPSGRDVSWSEAGGAKLDSDYSWAVVVLPIFCFCLLFVSDLFLCMFCRQCLLYVVGTLCPAGKRLEMSVQVWRNMHMASQWYFSRCDY